MRLHNKFTNLVYTLVRYVPLLVPNFQYINSLGVYIYSPKPITEIYDILMIELQNPASCNQACTF